MGLINFKDIDFKKSIDNENKVIDFNGAQIQIVNYLPINEKYDLIMITLQKAFEGNIYNPIKVDMYFKLHLIYMYTNILFNEEDRADETGLFDLLTKSGLIDAVITAIDENELEELESVLSMVEGRLAVYNNSISGFLTNTIDVLKEKLEKGMDMLKGFDAEKLQELLKNPQIASLLGGGADKGNNNLN